MINKELRHKFFISWSENASTITRMAIILGVLALTVIIAFQDSVQLNLVGIAMVGAVAAGLLLLTKPYLGLGLLVIASMLVPVTIGGSMTSGLNAAVLTSIFLIVLWVFQMVVKDKKIRLAPSRTNLPIIGLIVTTILAFINGQLGWFAFAQSAPIRAQLSTLALFLLSAGVFLVAANQINEYVQLRRLVWIFLALSAVYMFGRVTPEGSRLIRRIFQYGADASLFWVWVVSLAASQSLFNRKLSPFWRWTLGMLVLATFYVSMIQNYDWKSGWVPALFSLAVILWFGLPKSRLLILLGGMGILALYFFEGSDLLLESEEYSLVTRFEAWAIVLNIARVNPILGVGLANYYWYTPLFPILGYSVQFNSHNNYLDILAQTGILGLLFFLWLFWSLGLLARRLIQRVPDGFPKAYVYGSLGALAGTMLSGMLGDWILPFVYNVGIIGFRTSVIGWVFLGGLVALSLIYRQDEERKEINN